MFGECCEAFTLADIYIRLTVPSFLMPCCTNVVFISLWCRGTPCSVTVLLVVCATCYVLGVDVARIVTQLLTSTIHQDDLLWA